MATFEELLAQALQDSGPTPDPMGGPYDLGYPETPAHLPPPQAPSADGYGDRFAMALQGLQLPQPTNFLGGVVQGAARGFSGSRMHQITQREELNQALREEASKQNDRNFRATQAARALRAHQQERRDAAKAARDAKEPPKTLADIEAESAARARGTAAGSPKAPKEKDTGPLVPIQGPNGPVYGTREDALGKPIPQPSATTKVPSAAERQQIIDDNNVIRQTDVIRKNFRPEFVGPVRTAGESIGAVTGLRQNPEWAAFASDVSAYSAAAIHALYGGALTPTEVKRVRPQFPDLSDPGPNFLAKLARTQQRLREKASERRTTYSATGLDLSGLPEIPALPDPNAPNGEAARDPVTGKLVRVR